MKNKPVCYVLKERPEKHSAKKDQKDGAGAEIIFCSGCINNKCHDRNIHAPDHKRVGLGQRFQEITFK